MRNVLRHFQFFRLENDWNIPDGGEIRPALNERLMTVTADSKTGTADRTGRGSRQDFFGNVQLMLKIETRREFRYQKRENRNSTRVPLREKSLWTFLRWLKFKT